MHTCLSAIVANTSLPQNSRSWLHEWFFEIASLDVRSNTYISSYSGTHTCSHVHMYAHNYAHINIVFRSGIYFWSVRQALSSLEATKSLKCVHFLCGIFFDQTSLARGSLSQNFHFSHFQRNFSYVHVILYKVKCLLSSFRLNTSKMVETTKKFEISTLSYP